MKPYLDAIARRFPRTCSGQARRAAYFTFVRDIPYAVGISGPAEVIARNAGDCAGKNRLLAELLATLGVRSRGVTMRYRLPAFPEEVCAIPSRCDYHHTMEYFIEENWVLADPTYDPPLAKLGFTVTDWDGLAPTKPCVEPLALKREGQADPAFDEAKQAFDREIRAACARRPSEFAAYARKFNRILEEARGRTFPAA